MSTPRTVEGARWSCSGCGACCHGYQYGPVEPELVRWLEAQDLPARWAPAARHPWLQRARGPDGVEHAFLTRIDGHCIFLRPDNLCALHDLFGADRKPGFCREYPMHVVEDARGPAVVVRTDCFGAPRHAEDGELVAAQAADILALPRVVPRRPFAPAVVAVLPGVSVPTARWLAWEAELLDLLRQLPPTSPEQALAAVRARLYALAGESPPLPDPKRRRTALGALCLGARLVMQRAGPPPPDLPDFERALLTSADELLSGALAALERGDGLDGPISASAAAWLNETLAASLLGKIAHRHGGVAEGMGAWLLDAALARVALGFDAGAPAAALSPALPRWSRFVGNQAIMDLLRRARPALLDLFLST